MDDVQSLRIVHSDGRTTRWSPEEADASNVFSGLSYSSSIPGGDKSLTCELKRRADRDWPDLGLYDRVEVMGSGAEVLFSGELIEFPREHDQDFSISVGAVGRSAVLERFRNFQQVYVDRDPSQWGQTTLVRRASLALLNQAVDVDFTSSAERGIVFTGTTGKAIPNGSRSELMYRMPPGVNLSAIQYRGTQTNAGTITAAALYTDDNEDLTSVATTSLTLDDTLRTATPATAEQFGLFSAIASATYTPSATTPFARTLSKLAVYGDHGLTLQDNDVEPDGVYVSDVVEDIVLSAAPTLPIGEIQDCPKVIPHLTFQDPVTASEALAQVNKFAFWEFGAYGGEFFFREPDPARLTWRARLSDGAGISPEGPQAEDLYNGVIVYFTDTDGRQKSVGPVGSGSDFEDDSLRDSDPLNPLNAWGEVKWGNLSLSDLTTYVGAIIVGAAWLAEASTPKRRGSLILRDTVEHPTRGKLPVSRVKAGDWVLLSDFQADVARRIVQVDYNHDARTATCSLDTTPFLVEQLMELMGVNLVGTF